MLQNKAPEKTSAASRRKEPGGGEVTSRGACLYEKKSSMMDKQQYGIIWPLCYRKRPLFSSSHDMARRVVSQQCGVGMEGAALT
jgi:hypothetical protein